MRGITGVTARVLFLVTAGLVAAAGSSSALSSFLTDSVTYIPPNLTTMAPPPVGGSYVDPVFGVMSTRLTDATGSPALGIAPEYSQTSSFNLDDSYLVLVWLNGAYHLHDAVGNNIRTLPGVQEPRWSRTNPTHLYYRTGNKIMRVDAVTNQVVTINTFSQYGSIHFGGGTGDLSDNDRITVVGDNRYISIYDVVKKTQFGELDTHQAPINGSSFNFATITKDGDLFVVGYTNGTNRGQGMELYDLDGNFVVQSLNAVAHAAMGRDVDGTQVLFAANSATLPLQPVGCNNGLVKISLDATATRTCLHTMGWGIGWHFSAHGNDGWVYASTTRLQEDPWWVRMNEIFRVRADGSAVERIIHHRSNYQAQAYWREPHANISISGKMLVYGSDFHVQGQDWFYVDTYLINMASAFPPTALTAAR